MSHSEHQKLNYIIIVFAFVLVGATSLVEKEFIRPTTQIVYLDQK